MKDRKHRPLRTRMPEAIQEANRRAEAVPEPSSLSPVRVMPSSKRDTPTPAEEEQRIAVQKSIQLIESLLDVEFVAFFYESRTKDGIAVAGNINQRMTHCDCEICVNTLRTVRQMVESEIRTCSAPEVPESGTIQ